MHSPCMVGRPTTSTHEPAISVSDVYYSLVRPLLLRVREEIAFLLDQYNTLPSTRHASQEK